MRLAPQTGQPSGVGIGAEAVVSVTVTGSQLPRRMRSFCFDELLPCGSVVHVMTTYASVRIREPGAVHLLRLAHASRQPRRSCPLSGQVRLHWANCSAHPL